MTSPCRLLIVDDEEKITKVMAEFLSMKGYTVSTALNGEEALKKISADRPDVVLLDLSMPGIGGMEVLQRIKRDDTGLPVVIVSSTDREDAEPRARQLGAAAYLSKPVNLTALHETIERLRPL